MADDSPDPAMVKARERFEKSGQTLDWLGAQMGYPEQTARKSAWQFLNKTADPRLSMLRRFAKAMGIPIEELVSESGNRKRKAKGALGTTDLSPP